MYSLGDKLNPVELNEAFELHKKQEEFKAKLRLSWEKTYSMVFNNEKDEKQITKIEKQFDKFRLILRLIELIELEVPDLITLDELDSWIDKLRRNEAFNKEVAFDELSPIERLHLEIMNKDIHIGGTNKSMVDLMKTHSEKTLNIITGN